MTEARGWSAVRKGLTAKECNWLLVRGKVQGMVPFGSLQRECSSASILHLDFWPPDCKSKSVLVISYSSNRK